MVIFRNRESGDKITDENGGRRYGDINGIDNIDNIGIENIGHVDAEAYNDKFLLFRFPKAIDHEAKEG